MAHELTTVSIAWRKRRRNHRLLFGKPTRWVRLDWRRRLAVFEPGQLFGYERWRANQYGTQEWQIFILKAAKANTRICQIPGVLPGADLLLSAHGTTGSRRLLKVLDHVSETIRLDVLSEMSWRQIACLWNANMSEIAHLGLESKS